MQRLTTLICCLLLPTATFAQGEVKVPPPVTKGSSGEAGTGGTKTTELNDEGVHIVPDAIGLNRSGLLDKNGRAVSPAAAARIQQAMGGGDGAAGSVTPPTDPSGRKFLPVGSHLFTPTAFLRPRRLAGGEAGALHVLIQFNRDSVVPGGASATLELAPDNGPLSFGAPELDAPRKGRPGTEFAGQLVHEGTMVFKVPVTVKADAKHGKYPVTGAVTAEIHDASTGKFIGKFKTPIQGSVRIGKSLATGIARGAAKSASATSAAADEKKATSGPAVAKAPEKTSQPETPVTPSHLEATKPAGEGSDPAVGTNAIEPEPTGFSFLFLGLGLGLVLVLITVLVRRR